ncbi:long-chain fatty acid transport protein 2-like [Lineus longissimus]|uniref:long-chain fatty acid transport protein 2-like n=1 Tax=Lineus longissimus TaxID=88925 RepID=UPI00315D6CF9
MIVILLAIGGFLAVTIGAAFFFIPWLSTDIYFIYTCASLVKSFLTLAKKKVLIVDLLERGAKRHPNKTMLLFEGDSYCYEMVDNQANKVARFAQEIGLKTGDTVAMMALNSPEFVWTLFGFCKLGIRVALLNTNLRSRSLWHCISVSGANTLIVGKDLTEAIETISEELKTADYGVWIQGDHVPAQYNAMDEALTGLSTDPIDPSIRSKIDIREPAFYIYTSGTTGLPKAAIVTHRRCCGAVSLIGKVCNMGANDVLYVPLPLYHAAGLVHGIGGILYLGGTVVVRKKFSASQFWDDCRQYDVTVIMYIGELCRYLTNRPKDPRDQDHKVRCAYGNGLRPEVWSDFQSRFNIRYIREFYAATEGTGFLINVNNAVGAVGRLSPIFRAIYPYKLLRYDIEEESAYRGADGRCVEAEVGEPGLFVTGLNDGRMEFDGYKGKEDINERRILRNCFKQGDSYFNSGDLLVMDKMYNVSFVDRVGDTFRWKGENVSTTEVATVLADGQGHIASVNVYGVEVPGGDGRAGMAAITLHPGKSMTEDLLASLHAKVSEYLPMYARPLFLRILIEVQQTSTFKYVKGNVQREGFNPNVIKDQLFILDSKKHSYAPLTDEVYEQIQGGQLRL